MKYNPKVVLKFFRECGLPEPIVEYRFHPERRWAWDFAWPDHLLALEVEGGIWVQGGHNRGAQMKKDWEKRNTAVSMGWRYLLVEPCDLCMLETAVLVKDTIKV